MKPTIEQIDVLLKIQHAYQTDHTKGNKTFAEYVDIWWDFFWYRRDLDKKGGIDISTSIEERAKTSYLRSNVQGLTIASSHEVGYIQGATEQAEITKKEMIDKACEIYAKELREIMVILNKVGDMRGIDRLGDILSFEGCVKDFRKEMED